MGIGGRDYPSALKAQAIQVGHASAGYYSEEIEGAAISAMPGITRSYAEGEKAYLPLRDFMDRQFKEKYNVKVLFAAPWAHAQIMTTKRIESFTDLKGIKIRVPVKPAGDMIANLNGTPITMSFGEIYMALEKGVIDGYCTTIESIESEKFYEVIDYVNLFFTHAGLVVWLVSLDAFNELPEDIQKIVLEETEKAEREARAAGAAELETYLEISKNLGLEIVSPTPAEIEAIRKAAKPVWDAFYRKASPEARGEFIKVFERIGLTYTP